MNNYFGKNSLLIVIVLVSASFLLTNSFAANEVKRNEHVYPLDYCIVSGEKLGSMGESFIHTHGERELRFCCQGCLSSFKEKPDFYLKKLDLAIIEDQSPFYPEKTCLIDDNKLSTTKSQINYIYQNRLVRFCCESCQKEFKKSPTNYLKKLDNIIIKKQITNYPLGTCVIAGSELGGMGEPMNYVFGNRLVRFCCAGCVGSFLKNPIKHLSKIKAPSSK